MPSGGERPKKPVGCKKEKRGTYEPRDGFKKEENSKESKERREQDLLWTTGEQEHKTKPREKKKHDNYSP